MTEPNQSANSPPGAAPPEAAGDPPAESSAGAVDSRKTTSPPGPESPADDSAAGGGVGDPLRSPRIRADEREGIKALFEQVFFDVPYTSGAMRALERVAFKPPSEGDEAEADGRSVSASASEEAREEGESTSGRERPSGSVDRGKQTPRTVLLYRGESGVGKTRVFRQFRRYAEERRIPVYEIHCYDVEGIPFKPFLRVMREILQDFEFEDILREKYRASLEDFLPEIFQSDRDDDPGRANPFVWDRLRQWRNSENWESDKIRIFDGITQLLLDITAIRPIVVLVHDLNWGDRGTIELLRYIGRNILLRNSRVATLSSAGRGNEAELVEWSTTDASSFEDYEQVDLTNSGTRQPLGTALDSDVLPGRGAETAVSASGERGGIATPDLERRPVRLMVLANYEGSKRRDDYLDRSLLSLGREPFAYHGEIRTLELEETRGLVIKSLDELRDRRSVQGGESAQSIDVDDGAVDRIHAYSQGFPGFIHEILRLIRDRGEAGFPQRLDAAVVEEAMRPGAGTSPPAPVEPSSDEGEATNTGAAVEAKQDLSGPPPYRSRYRILERRLELLEASEVDLLRVLALARKPLTLPFLAQVLREDEDGVSGSLRRLADKGYLETVGQYFPHGGHADGHYFRIWDYAEVIRRSFTDAAQRSELHERIGAELRRSGTAHWQEKAFEVFYHSRRGLSWKSCVDYAFVASHRLARSFSVEKANLVLDELLASYAAEAEARQASGEEEPEEERRERLEITRRVLEQQAAFHVALQEYDEALAAIERLFKTAADGLEAESRAELELRQCEILRLAGDNYRALKTLSRAHRSIGSDSSPLAVRWHLVGARIRRDRNDVKRGINLGLKGIKLCQKLLDELDRSDDSRREQETLLKRELAELYRVVAQTFWQRGDDAHAVDNLQRSHDAFESLGDESASAGALDDLGDVYLERGNYFRAARYFDKALELKRRSRDIAGLCRSYDELGLVYLRTGDEIKTIGLLNHSILLKEKIGDYQGLNPTLGILGELYFRLGRYQKAIAYFRREMLNSQNLRNTAGLVDALIHQGWVYHEIGDRRRVEELNRQIGILSSEFKLKAQEAGGARLAGVYNALYRNWTEAEAQLKTALEGYSRLGNKRLETETLLDQAGLKYARESYSEALKLASKAVIAAEQLAAVDLQVRGLVLKGNIHRFLKRGEPEKSKELLRKGLELGQTVNDVHLLFDIYYSLAKVYHYDREFVEAGSFYGKAEAILRRVADDLPDDQAVRYFDHPQRKLFLEDANRYRKEVRGRSEAESIGDPRNQLAPSPAAHLREQPVGLPNYKDLNARVLKLNRAQHSPEFFDTLLREVVDMVHSERSFILRVQNRQYFLTAQLGFGDRPQEHGEFPLAQTIAEESIRKGRSILLEEPEDLAREGRFPRGEAFSDRSVLVIPLRSGDRIFAAIYMDRSLSLGKFTSRDQILAESLATHAAVALENRRHYEAAVVEPLTGLYATSYCLEELRETYRESNLHGRPFFLIGFYLPTLESSMKEAARMFGDRLAEELQAELPPGSVAAWGSPILFVLVRDCDFTEVDHIAQKVQGRLIGLVHYSVAYHILAPDARIPSALALFHELRRHLLPEEEDQHTIVEIRELLSSDISLKDAKRVLERHILEKTLRKTGGNITHAARELGIHRPQLSNLLKKHELKRERFERGVELDIDPRSN